MHRVLILAAALAMPAAAHAATFHAIEGGASGCPTPEAVSAYELGRLVYFTQGKMLGGQMGEMAKQCLPTLPPVQWSLVRMDGAFAVLRLEDAKSSAAPIELYFDPKTMVDEAGHHPG